MNKLFPSMCSKPEKFNIILLIGSWVWVFVLFPMYMPFVGLGIWDQIDMSVWLEIVYHVANGLFMLCLISGYLKEEWFMVTTDLRFYLKHIALTAGLIAGVELVLLGTLYLIGFDISNLLNGLPAVEMSLSQTPLLFISVEPILGAITLSIFVPISICALFYCVGFAPVCYKKPWLAYLCVAGITLIPLIIDILWRDQKGLVLSAYFVQLPVHLLACWSYQKTDNVWTPLLSLATFNLLASIVLPFIPV